MTSKLVIYGFEQSPPTRACILTAKALNLDFEFKFVDFSIGEHMSEEFLKKNPQHTVPVLEDGELFICDSHAIVTYLVQKYGKEEHQSLYPADLYERSLVDQRLFFDSGVLFTKMNAIAKCIFVTFTPIPEEHLTAVFEAYDFAEKFLQNSKYMVGNTLTVADFCCISTISSLQFVPIDPRKYPNLSAWIKRIKQLPYYEKANGDGARLVVDLVRSKLDSQRL